MGKNLRGTDSKGYRTHSLPHYYTFSLNWISHWVLPIPSKLLFSLCSHHYIHYMYHHYHYTTYFCSVLEWSKLVYIIYNYMKEILNLTLFYHYWYHYVTISSFCIMFQWTKVFADFWGEGSLFQSCRNNEPSPPKSANTLVHFLL